MSRFDDFMRDTIHGADPRRYIKSLGVEPFDWQEESLDPQLRRVMLLCARQAGKSTIVAGKALNLVKHMKNALALIICPSQDQSKEDMKKVEVFMGFDRTLPRLVHDNTFEKEFENGSRIIALPGSERSIRGYSGPTQLIIDEAARVLDDTYRAARPMMVGADTELILLSSAFGKRGFFYDAWKNSRSWTKILVKPAFDMVDGRLVEAMPEKEFKALYREQGISAYYSPRHTREFLRDEMNENPEWWIRQEYMCEFLDTEDSAFETMYLEMAKREYEPLFEAKKKGADYEPLEVESLT